MSKRCPKRKCRPSPPTLATFCPITTSYTPLMGMPLTLLNVVARYSPLSFCSIAVALGSGDPASATVDAIDSAIPRSPLVFVFIACGPLQTPLARGSVDGWIGCGADIERSVDHHAFGEYDVDHAARVDFDHGEYLLGERDVVVGEPVHRATYTGTQTRLESFVRIGGRDRAEGRGGGRRVVLRERRTNPAHDPSEQRVRQQLPLFGDKPPTHANFAVLPEDRALDCDLQRRAVVANARQVLGADIGAFTADVAIPGADHEALTHLAAVTVRQHCAIDESQ